MGETVDTGDVVGDLERRLAGRAQAVSSGIHIASEGTGTVSVDLMDRHGELRAGLDLCNGSGGQGVLSVLAHIDVASNFRPSALVHNVGGNLGIANEGGILLARADARAVPCESGVNLEADTGGRSCLSLHVEDLSVAVDQRDEGRVGQKARRRDHFGGFGNRQKKVDTARK